MRQELKTKLNEVLFDEPMSRYTSLRVGGAADALAYPRSVEEILSLIQWCRARGVLYSTIGSGTNLLVGDKGIRGVVISLSRGFGNFRIEGETELYAEGGVGIPRLVDFTASQGLSGMEPLAGIPGNLGGALVMNAGTPDGEIGSLVRSVTFIEREGKIATWDRDRIRFGYRQSHFPKGSILIAARLGLKQGSTEEIRERIRKERERRIRTQPLDVPNIGSVFKNPEQGFAGSYIEEAGLKNVRIGGARVSPKHANFIVNEGKATSHDVLALMRLMKDKVKEKFGISLEPEVRIVGDE